MKKTHRRQMVDYDRYDYKDKKYYGLFPQNGKLRIDVKRLEKESLVDQTIIKSIKSKKRNTQYFRPEKKSRAEYLCNYFRDMLQILKNDWYQEYLPAIRNIKTPEEVGNNTLDYNRNNGIADCDEWGEIQLFATIRRTPKYNEVIQSFLGQYVHYMASRIEQVTVKVLSIVGYEKDSFELKDFFEFVKQKGGIELNKIVGFEDYKAFRYLWNFLKHNTSSTYEKLKASDSSILRNKAYTNGDFALWFVKFPKNYIETTIDKLRTFFDNLCKDVFSEKVDEADWNYDQYFIDKFHERIEEIENPLGL